MLKNYLKIAFRNLAKYKVISFINLFGLTVGLACCLLILTYILHETSYDKYNRQADRIYRVTRSFNNKDGIVSLHLGAVSPPFGPLLLNDFPDLQKMTRLLLNGTSPIRYEEKLFNEENIFYADNNLFSLFDIPISKIVKPDATIEGQHRFLAATHLNHGLQDYTDFTDERRSSIRLIL